MSKKTLKAIGILSLLPLVAFAQEVPEPQEDLQAIVRTIVGLLLAVIFILGTIFLVLGGVMYVTAGGDATKVENAKNIMLYAVIGMGISALAWALMRFITQALFGWTL